jgi:hypothetical protein
MHPADSCGATCWVGTAVDGSNIRTHACSNSIILLVVRVIITSDQLVHSEYRDLDCSRIDFNRQLSCTASLSGLDSVHLNMVLVKLLNFRLRGLTDDARRHLQEGQGQDSL